MPTYVISTPPSANALFHNRKGGRFKTRAYTAWIKGELLALTSQRAKPVGVRAGVSIKLPRKTRGDCDNRIKPVLDLLVRAGILVDDRSDYVASVSISYDDVQMCHVCVTPEVA